MVERKEYLDQLWAWKDEQQIKVVTGIRRCGKSVLLEQYQQRLLAEGVAPEQIISINFEDMDNEPLKDYKALYHYLKEHLCAGKMTYIFLDEIQEVESFEKVVDSLYIRDGVDIYITGSNAYMLSSELSTLLSGRYTEIKMLPLSFREYTAVTGLPKEEGFAEFMKTGGIPYIAVMNRTDEKVNQYLEGIYNTVIIKDIEQRQARREKEDNPVSLYAATKKSNELMAHAYSKLYNIPSTGLRFFTVYGPAGRPDMAYFGFTNKLIKGDTIQIFNYGNCKRDFTYIDDIVEGVKRVMQGAPEKKNGEDGLPIPPYAVYNIGNSNPENLLDFVTILQEELLRAEVLPADYDFESHKQLVAMQPGDVPVTFADISALERDYGFKPNTSLRTGLRRFAQWYKEFYQV